MGAIRPGPGGGGGGSIPVTDPADLLSGATASRIVGTDGSGDGVLLTGAETRALINAFGSDANGDVMVRAGGVWTRLGVGSDGYVFTVVAGAPAWAASAGVSLSAANVFTAKQTLRFESGNYSQARICAAVRHRCSAVGQNFGAALAFESEEIGGATTEMGYVRARRNDDHRWVEIIPNRSNGTPPTAGLRCHCVGDVDAIYGVEVIVAASGGSPVVRPCVEGITQPDVDLTLTGLGAGGVVLPNARGLVGTVANITALTKPAGTMGFATNASGGPKPCWSTGSGWVIADGSALS